MKPISVTACALAALWTSAVRAQPSTHTALAEELFRAGRELSAQHRYREACEKLDASQKLDPAVGTLLSLGECYSGQGRVASAWLAYRSAASLANARGDPRGTAAEERAIAVEPQLSRVVIHTEDDPSRSGVRITINDEVFAPDVLGAPIPVDAGVVTIAETSPGYRTWSTRVEVRPFGDTATVVLPPLEPLPDPGVLARERARRSTKRAFGLGLGATGLVALSVGAVLGMQAITKIRDANRACTDGNACDDAGAVSENQRGRDFADAASAVIPAGVALAALGAWLLVTARAPSVPDVGADMSSGGARLRVAWSW